MCYLKIFVHTHIILPLINIPFGHVEFLLHHPTQSHTSLVFEEQKVLFSSHFYFSFRFSHPTAPSNGVCDNTSDWILRFEADCRSAYL